MTLSDAIMLGLIGLAVITVGKLVWLEAGGGYARRKGELDQAIAVATQKVLVVSTPSVAGSDFVRIIGVVRGVSDTQASTRAEFEIAEREAYLAMVKQAAAHEANAIVDARVITGTYEQQGSRWQVSQTIYTGTAVVLADRATGTPFEAQ